MTGDYDKRRKLQVGDFTPGEIASDLSWVPDTVSLGLLPLTAAAYVQQYLADPEEWWWTTNNYSPAESAVVLKRTLAIIKQARRPDHDKALGQLGVGPLENMMSNELLDSLQGWMPFTPAMCHALDQTRMEFEPPDVQRRATAMITASKRQFSPERE
ncbi:hypothetical protein ACHMW4_16590 [Mesorhizobium sp. UC22_110]|uniref:hypothetical protein n=1 Tax=unclassified Mesorhizobium TaxID=325217 RepID=UPI00366ACE69